MKNIPDISFQGSENTKDFELINLTIFFSKFSDFSDHNPSQAHRISFFSILLVTKGIGKHQIDLIDYELKEGTVLKIAKGQVHAFQKNPTYEGYLIIFTEGFILNYFSKSSINLITHLYNYHLSSPVSNDILHNNLFLKQLKQEIKEQNSIAQKNIIGSYINIYLLQLERKTKNKKFEKYNQRHFELFISFKNLLEKNFTHTRNVKDYAQMLFVSTKLLNQVVKEFTLNTAKTFIDDYVMLEAKRNIITTNQNIKEISQTLGFEEVTNFTKFFKNKIGLSPKAFKSNQNQ